MEKKKIMVGIRNVRYTRKLCTARAEEQTMLLGILTLYLLESKRITKEEIDSLRKQVQDKLKKEHR